MAISMCYNIFAFIWSTFMLLQKLDDGIDRWQNKTSSLCCSSSPFVKYSFCDDYKQSGQVHKDTGFCTANVSFHGTSDGAVDAIADDEENSLVAQSVATFLYIAQHPVPDFSVLDWKGVIPKILDFPSLEYKIGKSQVLTLSSQNSFVELSITTFLYIAQHPVPDLTIIDLKESMSKVLEFPPLESFQNVKNRVLALSSQNSFVELSIATFLFIVQHPVPDLAVLELKGSIGKVLEFPPLEFLHRVLTSNSQMTEHQRISNQNLGYLFEKYGWDDAHLNHNDITQHFNYTFSFWTEHTDALFNNITNDPEQSVCNETLLETAEIIEEIPADTSTDSPVPLETAEITKEIPAEASTDSPVVNKWIVGICIITLTITINISCAMNRKVDRILVRKISKRRCLERMLDEANADMRRQSQLIDQTKEKHCQCEEAAKKMKLMTCKQVWLRHTIHRAKTAKRKKLRYEVQEKKALRNWIKIKKCTLSEENAKLKKLEHELQQTLLLNDKINEQAQNDQMTMKKSIQEIEFKAEETLKTLKDRLEKDLKESNEMVKKSISEKEEAEEKLKAANLNLSSIQMALDSKKKQLLLNVALSQSAINDYKFMLTETTQSPSSSSSVFTKPSRYQSMMSSLKKRFSSLYTGLSQDQGVSVSPSSTSITSTDSVPDPETGYQDQELFAYFGNETDDDQTARIDTE